MIRISSLLLLSLLFANIIYICVSQPPSGGPPSGGPNSYSDPPSAPTSSASGSAPSTPSGSTDPQTHMSNDASSIAGCLNTISSIDTTISGLQTTMTNNCSRACPAGFAGANGAAGQNGTDSDDSAVFVGREVGASVTPNGGPSLTIRNVWVAAADMPTFNIPKDGVYIVFNQARLHNLQTPTGSSTLTFTDQFWSSRVSVTRCDSSRDRTPVVALCFGSNVDNNAPSLISTEKASIAGSRTCTGVFVGQFAKSDRITQQYMITATKTSVGTTPVYAGDENGYTALWAVRVGALCDDFSSGTNTGGHSCCSCCRNCYGGACHDDD
jgi:hypothetical protein